MLENLGFNSEYYSKCSDEQLIKLWSLQNERMMEQFDRLEYLHTLPAIYSRSKIIDLRADMERTNDLYKNFMAVMEDIKPELYAEFIKAS